MTTFHFSVALSLLLTGCSQQSANRNLVCEDIPGWLDGGPEATSAKQYELLEKCIHKWGARFALASGSNSEIAKAVIYRCRQVLWDYNTLRVRERGSISDSDLKATKDEIEVMALMRVVQQRAGQCPLPSEGR